MTDRNAKQAVENIILPIPSKDELSAYRKQIRRQKSPTVKNGDNWANSKIGEFSVEQIGSELIVKWQSVGGSAQSVDFSKLSEDPAYEGQRLDLGWMIANMSRVEAVRMLHAIPDPNEAMKQSDLYSREENRWRYWALNGNIKSHNKE